MPVRTDGNADLLLIDGTNVETPLMLARPSGDGVEPGDGTPLSLAEMIVAASADAPITKQLVPSIHINTGGGVGIDYNAFEGGYSRTPGFYCPAGAPDDETVPTGPGATNSPFVRILEFGGDAWFCQQGAGGTYGGRVLRSSGGSGAPAATTFSGTGNAYLPAGEQACDIIVANNGSRVPTLYLATTDATQGRLYRWNTGTSQWTAPTAFGAGEMKKRLAKVHWQTPDGTSGWRMVAISGDMTISYTLPDADPMTTGNWVTGVPLGTAFALTELVAARHHVYALAKDGLFDLDGMGNSPNLTSYLASETQTGTGAAGIYHNNYVYMSVGRGIDRIYVGSQGQLQERPGQCAPGWGTAAENAYRGYATAFCTDQGYLVAAIHNPSSKVTGIFWGLDQETQGSRNPMTWYGPEFFFTADYKVTSMATSGATGTDLRLWVGAQSVAGGTPIIRWMSLPVAGSPLQDMLSSGSMAFNTGAGAVAFTSTYCRLSLMSDPVGDEISTKILDRNGVGSRGLSIVGGANDGIGTKLTVYSRADPAPGSTSWGTGVDVTTTPSQTVLPAATTSGNRHETRVDFFSPNGGSSPPKPAVMTTLRRDYWRAAPTFGVIQPIVEYGPGVRFLNNNADERDPDTVTSTLRTLMGQGRITVKDRQGKKWTVHVEQVQEMSDTLHETGFGKTAQARLELTIVAGPL